MNAFNRGIFLPVVVPGSEHTLQTLPGFIPIAPASRTSQRQHGCETRKYQPPDFIGTVKLMRLKLLELQGASESDEPSALDKKTFSTWKRSIELNYGHINDLRKYIQVAQFSNQNFEKVLEIANNATRCSKSGRITQYTFKWISKSMDEEELYRTLNGILHGEVTLAELNRKRREKPCKTCTKNNTDCNDHGNNETNDKVRKLERKNRQLEDEQKNYKARNEDLQLKVSELGTSIDANHERNIEELTRIRRLVDEQIQGTRNSLSSPPAQTRSELTKEKYVTPCGRLRTRVQVTTESGVTLLLEDIDQGPPSASEDTINTSSPSNPLHGASSPREPLPDRNQSDIHGSWNTANW